MSDEDILDKTIDLSKSCLNRCERSCVMKMLKGHKAAFSLWDEIGKCPNIRLNIDVIDDSPFFVRPFKIAEKDKPLMDKQMNRLIALGTLSRNNTSHTSPVMLISRKVTQDKRPVVDFRLLNTRIRRRNTMTPLLRDIFDILGKAKCEVMSCIDIKNAFHSIRLRILRDTFLFWKSSLQIRKVAYGPGNQPSCLVYVHHHPYLTLLVPERNRSSLLWMIC